MILSTVRLGCTPNEEAILSESLDGSRVSRNPASPGRFISRKLAFVGCLTGSLGFSEATTEAPSSERVRPPMALTGDIIGSRTSGLFSGDFIIGCRFDLTSIFSSWGGGFKEGLKTLASPTPIVVTLGFRL